MAGNRFLFTLSVGLALASGGRLLAADASAPLMLPASPAPCCPSPVSPRGVPTPTPPPATPARPGEPTPPARPGEPTPPARPGEPATPARPGETPTTPTPPTGESAAPGTQPGSAQAQDAFARAGEAGTQPSQSFAPNMFGDLPASQIIGPVVATLPNNTRQILPTGSTPTLPQGTVLNVDLLTKNVPGVPAFIPAGQPLPRGLTLTSGVPPTRSPAASIPVVARGAFKITENESPLPQDRFFVTYDYFNNLNAGLRTFGMTQSNLHREVVGFEKTLLDGDASIGMRVPILQVTGDPLLARSDIGATSFIFKYAFVNNRSTGNVLSGGLVITTPTGSDFLPAGVPNINDAMIQPFVGGRYLLGNLYLQGFSSINVPTDSRDVVYLFNDLGTGYIAYRASGKDQWLTMVIPTLELHINTPLNHRGSNQAPIPGLDIVDTTAGVWFQFHQSSTFGVGGVVPLTGPRPFDFQIFAQLNIRF